MTIRPTDLFDALLVAMLFAMCMQAQDKLGMWFVILSVLALYAAAQCRERAFSDGRTFFTHVHNALIALPAVRMLFAL